MLRGQLSYRCTRYSRVFSDRQTSLCGHSMKSITDFFPKKTEKKRALDGASVETQGVTKRAVTVPPSGNSDGQGLESNDLTDASGARQSPLQLGQTELRELGERTIDVARLRVEQATAQQTQPSLADLLVNESWKQQLRGEFEKAYMPKLQAFLNNEWKNQRVFPPKHLLFRAMNVTPFDQVRVVIIGQDPYHNEGQAMGLSFSVPLGQPVPSSLQNIYKELKNDCGCTIPKHGDLTKWSSQGVLLLNAALTVRAHSANSHAKQGWQHFTNAAIRALSTKRKGLVFLLWGRNAQAVEPLIAVDRHHVLKCAHPSGLSASKGFFGCKHFSKSNQLLEKAGLPTIDWQIDS